MLIFSFSFSSLSLSAPLNVSLFDDVYIYNAFNILLLMYLKWLICIATHLIQTEEICYIYGKWKIRFSLRYKIFSSQFHLPTEKDFHDNEHEWASLVSCYYFCILSLFISVYVCVFLSACPNYLSIYILVYINLHHCLLQFETKKAKRLSWWWRFSYIFTIQVKYLGSENARGLWGIKHTRRPVDHLVRI